MDTTTQQQFTAMLEFIRMIGDAIYEAGPAGIPSGHLYAMLVGKVSLDMYHYAIGILKDAGVVTEQSHRLRWTGQVKSPIL